ncbi:dephospho-CoA kinase [Enterococcus sp. DIV1271a]|uniref:dephospho-CoA kinase n=2 Tax=Enterococcus TaxID=1350 RepID=UPI001F614610|nr:dephospho-CoA kinase [Enterococcus sp. DIV1271a]
MSNMSETKNTQVGFVLGLTGGIATGKSTAAAVFQQYGFPVIDADQVAREVVEPETPGLQALVQAFGKEILQKDGQLDRQKLGQLIFGSVTAREQLNQVLDPFIRGKITEEIVKNKATHPLVVVDIPLLFEGHYDAQMDAVAVVYIPESQQIDRLMARNQLTKQEAEQRVKSQLSIEEKKRRADIVFDNRQTKEDLSDEIKKWLSFNRFL